MHSWLVTVLFLARTAYGSGSQGAVRGVCVYVFGDHVCTEYIDA